MEGSAAQWILFVFTATGLGLLLTRPVMLRFSGLEKPGIWLLFGLKVTVGLALTAVYTFYYPDRDKSDTWKYFNDGKVLQEAGRENPLLYFKLLSGNYHESEKDVFATEEKMGSYYRSGKSYLHADHRFMIKLHSLLHFVSLHFMPVHLLWFNFLSLLILLLAFGLLRNRFPEHQLILWLILAFTPPLLIWGSGALKETLLLPLVALFFAIGLMIRREPAGALLLFPVWGLVWMLKPYIAVLLLAGIIPSGLVFIRHRAIVAGIGLVLMIGGFLYLPGVLDYATEKIVIQRNEFARLAELEHAGSLLRFPENTIDFKDLVRDFPRALYVSVLMPFPGQMPGWTGLYSGIENALFLSLVLFLAWKFHYRRLLEIPLLTGMLLFALALLLLTGWGVPVLGSVVRYRTPAQLCLLLVLGLGSNNLYFSKYQFFSPFLPKNKV